MLLTPNIKLYQFETQNINVRKRINSFKINAIEPVLFHYYLKCKPMQYRHLIFAALLGFSSAFFSCKKNAENPASISNYAPLVPASSGWEKIGLIKYSYQNMGFYAYNDIRPVDMQKSGNEVFVLYSEDYRFSGTIGKQFYKARFTPGSGDTAVSTKLNMSSGTNRDTYFGLWKQQLLPGSFTAISLKYFSNPSPNTYIGIVSETNQDLGSFSYRCESLKSKVYSNGDVLAGSIDYSALAELDFYTKATNSWKSVRGTSHDTTTLIDYTPFRLGDGSLWAFNLSTKNDKTYLAMANPSGLTYPNPLFTALFLQEIPELAFNYFEVAGPKILGCTQDENSIVVAIGHDIVQSHPTKISAYKWTKGSNIFTTLYKNIPIIKDEARQLEDDEAKCLMDGTMYKWWQIENSGSILVVNKEGVQHLGQITFPNYIFMGGITWLDGDFYGAAYLYSDQQDTDHKMRMDILKLKK